MEMVHLNAPRETKGIGIVQGQILILKFCENDLFRLHELHFKIKFLFQDSCLGRWFLRFF